MKGNKWLSILLAALLVVSVVACDDSEDETTKTKNKSGVKVSGGVIDLSGGEGAFTDWGTGGDGGEIDSYWYGSGGIRFTQTGRIKSTNFTVPTYTNVVDLGTNGWEVASSVLLDTVTVEPADGVYHLHQNSPTVQARVLGADVAVTGLRVNRNVILTINANYNIGGVATCLDRVIVDLPNDVEIIGTVTTSNLMAGIGCVGTPEVGATTRDRQRIEIQGNRVYLRAYGLIDNSGDDATVVNDRGGNGGYIYVWADAGLFIEGDTDATGGNGLGTGNGGNGARAMNGGAQIDLQTDGVITNTGNHNASGGAGQSGGAAGGVYVGAEATIWSTGDLLSNGGAGGAAGAGGDANYVELDSWGASVLHRGSLESIGGDGGIDGGQGGDAYLYASESNEDIGRLIGSGVVDVSGGSATVNGDGDDAGYIYAYSYGAYIHTTTRFIGNGGNGAGATGDGGDGADIHFYIDAGDEYYYGEPTEAKEIVIANDIIATGGTGYYGGDGGYVEFEDSYDGYGDIFGAQASSFIGFNVIRMNGGDGEYGGDGGYLDITGEDGYTDDTYTALSAVILNVPMQMNGGDADYIGGDGGRIDITMEGEAYDENSIVLVNASISMLGGDSDYYGGDGGYIYMFGHEGVTINAPINASAGAGWYYEGGDGYDLYFIANTHVINNSVISANGGYGEDWGGDGGDLNFYAGKFVINNGAINARGGNSDLNDAGDGGEIWTLSEYGKTKNTGSVNVAGGQATLPADDGLVGFIYFDFTDVTPADGTL